MEFVFRPEKIGLGFTEEIALILSRRTEIASRKKMPALWDKIDRINKIKASQEVLQKHKKRRAFYGVILIAIGFFLFIPGLLKPKELFVPFAAGAFSIINGIFAVMPRKSPEERFEKSAEKLIKTVDSLAKSGDSVIFREENILKNGKLFAEYSNITETFETKNFFFIACGEKAVILRKCDLVCGKNEEIRLFIEEKTEKKVLFCE